MVISEINQLADTLHALQNQVSSRMLRREIEKVFGSFI